MNQPPDPVSARYGKGSIDLKVFQCWLHLYYQKKIKMNNISWHRHGFPYLSKHAIEFNLIHSLNATHANLKMKISELCSSAQTKNWLDFNFISFKMVPKQGSQKLYSPINTSLTGTDFFSNHLLKPGFFHNIIFTGGALSASRLFLVFRSSLYSVTTSLCLEIT